MSNIRLIVGREFNERVRKKSFIVTTILMPVLMVALMVAPALIMRYARGETKRIAVIDESGLVLPRLESGAEVLFEPTELPLAEARAQLGEHFGVLRIGADILSDPNDVALYANGSVPLVLEERIVGQIEEIIEQEKLRAYDIGNLQQILDEVRTSVTLSTFRNDEPESPARSSAVATFTGFGLGMVLYMFLLIYGAMVMQSVIEEKQSRVLEVIVSSVRPFDLMMGKILGVACVAVVQILLWGVLVGGVGTLVMPHLISADLMSGVEALHAGTADTVSAAAMAGMDPAAFQAVATALDFGYVAALFGWLLLFLVGGYLLYSAMFAAVGSSVDNMQDASQLQSLITMPVLIAFFVAISVMKDPNSQLAFWFSIIPFTSPVVMMARIPCGIPLWEILLSLGLLYLSFVAMVWVAAKIYRVGIFMYGKKPSLREMARWVRYR